MKLDQKLVDSAIEFVKTRYPEIDDSWRGAAALYTQDGKFLISTFGQTHNAAVDLCHETGAICEAHRDNKVITASVCVTRAPDGAFHILPACGVCQERLWTWGGDVEFAVPKQDDLTKWEMKTLKEVAPYYWNKPYMNEK